MRHRLIFVWFWLSVWTTLRAQTLVNHGSCQTGTGSCTITLSLTSGNTLLCVSSSDSSASNLLTIADNKSGTYTNIVDHNTTGSSSVVTDFWRNGISTTSSTIITCSYSIITHDGVCSCLQYSSLPNAAPEVSATIKDDKSTWSTIATNSALPGFTNELCLAFTGYEVTSNLPTCSSASNSYNIEEQQQRGSPGAGDCVVDKNVASPASQSTTFTMSGNVAGQGGSAFLYCFKSSSSVAASGVRHRAVSY